jgi:hypothetical protein
MTVIDLELLKYEPIKPLADFTPMRPISAPSPVPSAPRGNAGRPLGLRETRQQRSYKNA